MIQTVAQKITNTIISIALIAQNVFPACGLHANLTTQNQGSVHFFEIEKDSIGNTGTTLKETTRKIPTVPGIAEEEFPENEADEWKMGWETEEEFDDGDILSFFPETPEMVPNAHSAPQKITLDAEKSRPFLHPIPIDSSFSDPSANPIVKKMLSISADQTIKNSDAVVDNDPYDWDISPISSQQPGDISSAKMHTSSIIRQDIQEPEKEQKAGFAESPKEKPSALGQKIVTVDPYLSIEETGKGKKNINETLFSSKTAESKAVEQKTRKGILGSQNSADKKTETRPQAQPAPDNEIIAQVLPERTVSPDEGRTPPKTISINFNNISIIEYIRFISRITNRNFIFDENDLQFNVTIISEEPTSIENVMTALIQELRIHGLFLIEQDNNLIIHKNSQERSISRVNTNGAPKTSPRESEIVTQVFKLNTLDPGRAQRIVAPLLSANAIIEVSEDTRHVIVTDLVTNIKEIEILFKDIDSPNSGLVIGQYVVRNSFIDNLIELAKQIMDPIAKGQTLTFVPHATAKSIFIVSSPFLVERTISVLQHLDRSQGTTKIYDLEELKFRPGAPTEQIPGLSPDLQMPPETPEVPEIKEIPSTKPAEGRWELNPQGSWIFRPGFPLPAGVTDPSQLPQGNWLLDPQNRWYFKPEGTTTPFDTGIERGTGRQILPGESPRGRWVLDPQGSWIFQLSPEEEITPVRFTRPAFIEEELPVGHIERTKFFIHKLQYRRGEDIVIALNNIANSLNISGASNRDLISAVESVQWLEASNSLVFAGTENAIEKVRGLIDEIDLPLRQVFIEMLILETTLEDSLNYGVSWATRSGGGNTATAQAFVGGASPLTSIINADGTPNSSNILTGGLGYTLGIIGRRLTHNGTQFATIGALVTALHNRITANVVMNPKIVTEDNKTAEIFVGINAPFQTNSISNDEGSVITSNFEYRDVGTTMRVTPLIAEDLITLIIEQEVSRLVTTVSTNTQTENTPTTAINRTTTTVHVPNKHFVVISGLMDDQRTHSRNQFPCLGGIPILGAAFSAKVNNDIKRNLMIFIMPWIVDTDDELRQLTSDQQEIFKQKNRTKKDWKYEVDEGMDLLNIKPSCCDECD